ncbi:Ribonuclease Z [Ignavibacterium album JCM 16511]|uniref:Ribonuclease Z n=1 Tax=Ignavibacterium album (strain DSM 19864 / JCM 16511 / NBRC 101810 / Mat9-16) TaxID=945713 RepID=I0AH67_IGNAJ|nr:MBL fold metallo-hydrolase [Ignavibacterium album]AFH48324.1 Ribonuclease Z [Ignavibacterium album JCM 16511]
MLKIKFIGTGSAKTSLKRNFTSLLFKTSSENILIDCGEGTSKALIQQNVELNSIDKIIISHLHSDHFTGLAGLITNFKLDQRKKPIHLFTHQSNVPFIKNYLLSSLIIPERMDFEILFKEFTENEEVNLSEDLKFVAKQNSHLDKYKIHKKNYSLPSASPTFLFIHYGKKIIYTSDIGSADDLLLFSEPIDILICEISHIELNQLIDLAKKLNPSEIYLIHIPDEKEKDILEFLSSDSEAGKIVLTFDGLEVAVY